MTRCRICNRRTSYPICSECADEKELEMIKTLHAVGESIQLAKDRKKALFLLIMPFTRTMIAGMLLIVISIVLSANTAFSFIYWIIMFAGELLFITSWIMHPPMKTEALADYHDMKWRIIQLKERKNDIINALLVPSEEWDAYDKRLLTLNIYGSGMGN
jgi:hypothetical protein